MTKRKLRAAVTLDNHVSIPVIVHGNRKYPWHEMKVGQSFWAPVKPSSLASTRYLAEHRTGFKFAVKLERSGSRVWRIH